MKRVLVLTGRYLPKMSANGICINNVLQSLPVKDYQVTCLCYDDNETMQDEVVKIIRVSRGPIKSFLYKNERNRTGLVRVLYKAINFMEKVMVIPFLISWPWNDPIFTNRVYRIAERLHKEAPFDYIIAVHMPISSLIVANRMKKKYPQIKYIPYFLDSLSGGRPTSLLSEKTNREKKLRWEERLLPNADKIVVMEASRNHHEKYSIDKPYYSKFVYLDIPLLCDKERGISANPFIEEKNKINVTFSGVALQPMRNMSFFIRFAEAIHSLDSRIVFHIIGQCNCSDKFDNKIVRYYESMPHEQLLPYLEYSDVLLNFGVRVPSAISGKIFEYMTYGKPIISTYSIPNEACIPYLNRYPLALLIEESDERIVESARTTVEFINESVGKQVIIDEIKDRFRNNLPETFIEEVFDKEDVL